MLTDMHCRTAKPRERLYRLNGRDGLYLEVKPNGVKAFRYRFKLGGKESMMALGEYPATPLSEAREKAHAARKLVKDGINPVQQKQLDKVRQELDRSNTLELIAVEWLATKDWEDVTKKRRLDMLRRVVFPALGKLPVRDITAHQVLAILQTTHAPLRLPQKPSVRYRPSFSFRLPPFAPILIRSGRCAMHCRRTRRGTRRR